MFDLNRHYDRPENRPPIQIKHIHSSLSYQQGTYQKYDRRDYESPSGYGPLIVLRSDYISNIIFHHTTVVSFPGYTLPCTNAALLASISS